MAAWAVARLMSTHTQAVPVAYKSATPQCRCHDLIISVLENLKQITGTQKSLAHSSLTPLRIQSPSLWDCCIEYDRKLEIAN